jgi:hypothetical protein
VSAVIDEWVAALRASITDRRECPSVPHIGCACIIDQWDLTTFLHIASPIDVEPGDVLLLQPYCLPEVHPIPHLA